MDRRARCCASSRQRFVVRAARFLATAAVLAGCDLRPPGPNAPEDAGLSVDAVIGGESCDDLAALDFACGGSPVGSWEIVTSCAGVDTWDPLNGTCDAIQTRGEGTASGTLTVEADGGYSLRISERVSELFFSFPLSCFGGATEPCNGANFMGVCENVDTRCSCDVNLRRGPITEDGAWVALGGDLMFQEGLDTTNLSFCRVGSEELRMIRFSPDNSDELSWAFVLKRVR